MEKNSREFTKNNQRKVYEIVALRCWQIWSCSKPTKKPPRRIKIFTTSIFSSSGDLKNKTNAKRVSPAVRKIHISSLLEMDLSSLTLGH